MNGKTEKQANNLTILFSAQEAINVALFAVCWKLFYINRYQSGWHPKAVVLMIALYIVLLLTMNRSHRVYDIGIARIRELIYNQAVVFALCGGTVWVVSDLMWNRLTNPLPLLLLIAAQTVLAIVLTQSANKAYYRVNRRKQAAVIYQTAEDLQRLESISDFENKYALAARIANPQSVEDCTAELQGSEVLFVMGIPATLRNAFVKYAVENGKVCMTVPHVGDVIMQGAEHMQSISTPFVRVQRARPSLEYRAIKRLFDIAASAAALLLTSPIMLATAIAIKACDHGPVFYRQTRLTKDRKEFRIYKFRSMRTDAEGDGKAQLAKENDARITPVGRVIRRYRIDELPQLINILQGDMSIVGPRPERPEFAEIFEQELPAFSLRLQVKAGLTGYAQVYGRYNSTAHDKLELDLLYINRMSLVEDLRVILATVRILFEKESTQGFEETK